jgi:trehalose 6-phosphate synthase/phosphatase
MKRLIIVTNRLPVRVIEKRDKIELLKSPGGLATGLDSLNIEFEIHWIGWPGGKQRNQAYQKKVSKILKKKNIHPVFLSQEELNLYYEGYSNSTLWPLFHYFLVYTQHKKDFWNSYHRVNQRFMEEVVNIASKDDLIWVQDYHLMLLPEMIRQKLPGSKIGFFLHIPFPSYELFRTLENREKLLNGLLGSDLIGFHTFDYMRHFMSSVYRILGLETINNQYYIDRRIVSVDSFPMGIDYEKFHEYPITVKGRKIIENYKSIYPFRKLILSVDRLDYTKGIHHRLQGFDLFLAENPGWRGKVSLFIIAVPSRDTVKKYTELKIQIDETIGKINGKYSQPGWIPIHYYYKNFKTEELTALYYLSSVALVTPLRDGMNLVAKEYVAAKNEAPGVLILSEMAGASDELSGAILINPNNIHQIADAIKTALAMPVEEQMSRLGNMQIVLKKNNVNVWATNFIKEIKRVIEKTTALNSSYITASGTTRIVHAFRRSRKRIFLLDYDGTLVSFSKNPEKALPDAKLMNTISGLLAIKNTRIAVISGRSRAFLERIFGGMEIMMVAEHGAYRKLDGKWKRAYHNRNHWKDEILNILNEITMKTPGSFIEEKESSIAWHFRNTDIWLAELRVGQLISSLIYPCTRNNLSLMKGEKVIEVKHSEFTKGTAARIILETGNYDFIFAAGDDTTDLDMLDAVPSHAFKIKSGIPSEKATYNVAGHKDVIKILEKIIN